jgi:Domain of unknown function (DUF4189)
MNWASGLMGEPTTFGVSVCSAKLGPVGSGLMRLASRRLLAVLLMAAGLLGGVGITAPTARAAVGWGAIAISPTTGKVGYSGGRNSAIEAEQAAVSLCKAHDCRAVVNFTKGCGAVAQATNTSWGWGSDPSSTGAQNRALVSCNQYGAGCRVSGWICS